MYDFQKCFDETKYMVFWIKDDQLLNKYIYIIWDKVSNRFNIEPIYNQKYLKTKIKSYKRKINKNFHDNAIPKEDSHCIFLSLMLIDSAF